MKQGKFGLRLAFYAVLAFVLALLNQPLLCGALLAFVIVAERDRWAVRQVMQGFLLSLTTTFFLDTVYVLVSAVPLPYGFIYDFITGAQHVLSILIYIASLVLCIIAMPRVLHDREADLPLFSNLAYWACGEQKPRPVKQQPFPPQSYQPPMYQQPMQPQQGQPQQGQPAPFQPMPGMNYQPQQAPQPMAPAPQHPVGEQPPQDVPPPQ